MIAAWPGRVRLGLAGLAFLVLGLGSGFTVAHWTAQQVQPLPLLSPSSTQPRDAAAAERRAIALVIGQTRPTDGMAFDAWYRARLNKLAPGIVFRYEALLSGNDVCGSWAVYAVVIGGPQTGPANTAEVLNEDGPVGSVDETTGVVVGLNTQNASVHFIHGGCAENPLATGQTWLDEFRAGAVP